VIVLKTHNLCIFTVDFEIVFFFWGGFSVAELLKVDSKKLSWSFLNYCVVVNGTAVRRKQTVSGVYESMRVFAQTLYARLFDWIVNTINLKLSLTRAIL
jgi:myosin III